MTLEALIPLYGGYMLSRDDGVVFLTGALPGEVVEAEVVEKRKDYSVASVKEVVKPSPDRVTPLCPVFGVCGGCHYQYIAYHRQVSIKEEVALDCIKRIGKIEVTLDPPLVSEPWHYRKRAQFKVSPDGRIGFYRALSHDVVELDECLLLAPEINNVLKHINSTGFPRGVKEVLLQCGDILVAMVRGEGLDYKRVFRALMNAGVSGVTFEDGAVEGARQICLDLNGYYYMVSGGSFFQGNWSVNRRVVSLVTDFVDRIRPARVIDLYAGAGNFSIPVAPYVGEVVAVEENTLSFRDGQENLQLNGIENIKFINRRVEDFKPRKGIDLVILDPPRAGLAAKTVKELMDLSPGWLIYISCNPSTFARDLNRLKDHYMVESVRVVDMFAQTYHVELFGILKRK